MLLHCPKTCSNHSYIGFLIATVYRREKFTGPIQTYFQVQFVYMSGGESNR